MEIIFHSHANKTHFHKKDCAPSLILKVRVFGSRKWLICVILENFKMITRLKNPNGRFYYFLSWCFLYVYVSGPSWTSWCWWWTWSGWIQGKVLYHSLDNNCFIIRSPSLFVNEYLQKRSDLPFSRKSDRKKEKIVVSFTHEQNIICSQAQLDGIAHGQTIICRQLFAGKVVCSRPMKNLHRMIKI